MLRYPMLAIFVVYAAGTSLGRGLYSSENRAQNGTAAVLLILAILCIGAGVMAWRRQSGTALAAFALSCVVGVFHGAWRPALNDAVPDISCPNPLWQSVVVEPVSRRLGNEDTSAPQVQSIQRTVMQLQGYRCVGQWRGVPAQRASVSFVGGPTIVRNDVLWGHFEFEVFKKPLNPVGIDPQAWARQHGIDLQAKPLSPFAIHRRQGGIWATIDAYRANVAGFFNAELPQELAALAKALGTGDRSDISAAQRERWADSGIAHLLAISGLHVATVAVMLFMFIRYLITLWPGCVERLNANRWAAGLCLPLLIFFLFWVGAPVSAVRATIMAGALLGGIMLDRVYAPLNALALAGLALVVSSADALVDISFLLSFVAVMGLLLWNRHAAAIRERTAPTLRLKSWRRRLNVLKLSMITSAIATIATAPITAYAFGRVAWVSILSNVVAVPLATFVALPATLLSALGGGGALSAGVLPVLGFSLRLLDLIADFCSPWGAIDSPPPHAVEIILYYSVALALPLWWWARQDFVFERYARYARWICVLGGLSFGLCLGARVHERVFGNGLFIMEHPYVGQGDAAILRFPKGKVMLFDAGGAILDGTPDPGRAVLGPLLRKHSIHTIDIAVISHPHPDHINGYAYIAERFRIKELWWNGEGAEHPVNRQLRSAVRRAGGRVYTVRELDAQIDMDGVQIRPLHPRPAADNQESYFSYLNRNNNSVVLHLRFGERTFFLGGDIEKESEATLAVAEDFAAEVFKSPHHGSKTSSTESLLSALHPKATIISCGVHNFFKFPRQETLERYEAYGLEIFRTDRDGLIRLYTDGHTSIIESFSSQRRFVVHP